MVRGILDYDMMINRQSLPLEQAGGAPLDMSQYYKLLGTCRIPHIPADALEFHTSSHIVVCHRNNFFEMATCHPDGDPLTEGELLHQLKDIEANSKHAQAPIGVLTTEHRDRWAKAYKTLCRGNQLFIPL
ncbi:CRAT [Cordylochernes scorpioides]|uniref:CRAT n=1 Tax=Cordylochernes scorpioides TaxID=51811 RepID=A0ABY6L8I1_9ARAC|nr:CRAT [Cordylochernes scorpioides]